MTKSVSGIIELEAIIADLSLIAESFENDIPVYDLQTKTISPALPPCPGLIKYDRELTFCIDRLSILINYIAKIATMPIVHVAL